MEELYLSKILYVINKLHNFFKNFVISKTYITNSNKKIY